jgi:outer membrane protein OmpA-like peptidoglycan-associated protein
MRHKKTRGYGTLLPTSCNDTDEGRHKNRRVETWLR